MQARNKRLIAPGIAVVTAIVLAAGLAQGIARAWCDPGRADDWQTGNVTYRLWGGQQDVTSNTLSAAYRLYDNGPAWTERCYASTHDWAGNTTAVYINQAFDDQSYWAQTGYMYDCTDNDQRQWYYYELLGQSGQHVRDYAFVGGDPPGASNTMMILSNAWWLPPNTTYFLIGELEMGPIYHEWEEMTPNVIAAIAETHSLADQVIGGSAPMAQAWLWGIWNHADGQGNLPVQLAQRPAWCDGPGCGPSMDYGHAYVGSGNSLTTSDEACDW